jgi:hypothetical protein
MLCHRTILETVIGNAPELTAVELELEQFRSGDEEPVGVVGVDPPQVHFRVGYSGASMSLDAAIQFAEQLGIAAHKAKAISEGRA